MATNFHPQPAAGSADTSASQGYRPEFAGVRKALTKRSFAVLATTSPAGRPHAAAVLYELVDRALYVNTRRASRKARNVAANPYVAVSVPIRRLPVGPPSTVQFQGEAAVVDLDSSEIEGLIAKGHLKSITSHGELATELQAEAQREVNEIASWRRRIDRWAPRSDISSRDINRRDWTENSPNRRRKK